MVIPPTGGLRVHCLAGLAGGGLFRCAAWQCSIEKRSVEGGAPLRVQDMRAIWCDDGFEAVAVTYTVRPFKGGVGAPLTSLQEFYFRYFYYSGLPGAGASRDFFCLSLDKPPFLCYSFLDNKKTVAETGLAPLSPRIRPGQRTASTPDFYRAAIIALPPPPFKQGARVCFPGCVYRLYVF